MSLHLTKVAYGATSLDDLRGWFATRGAQARLTTRYLPKRHEEIAGKGSLFWIYKHQLVMRSPILGFEDAEGGKTHIVISTALIAVRPAPKRAHQGWRYLAGDDAPRDLAKGEAADMEAMPSAMLGDLVKMGLV